MEKDGSVLLWKVNSAREHRDFPYHGWSRPVFSPDGKSIVLVEGYADPRVLIECAGRPTLKGPQGWSACGFCRDGSRLLLWSAKVDPALRWWDIGRSAFGAVFEGAEGIGALALVQTGLSTDGGWVFQAGRGGALTLWNAAGGAPAP